MLEGLPLPMTFLDSMNLSHLIIDILFGVELSVELAYKLFPLISIGVLFSLPQDLFLEFAQYRFIALSDFVLYIIWGLDVSG